MFIYFVHNIPLLHDHAESVPTFFPSVLAPIIGPMYRTDHNVFHS
jgi:hypothetical protein